MRYSFAVLILLIVSLSGCSSDGWPGQFGVEDPTAYDFPIVGKRWDAASKQPLGSEQDIAEIKAAVRKSHPDLSVREIRWISAIEVMVFVVRDEGLDLGMESFYCALKKDGDVWHIIAWYSDIIS